MSLEPALEVSEADGLVALPVEEAGGVTGTQDEAGEETCDRSDADVRGTVTVLEDAMTKRDGEGQRGTTGPTPAKILQH